MCTEIMVSFVEDEKKNGYPILHFYPVCFLKNKPISETKLYETVLNRTGSKRIATSLTNWAVNAAVGEKKKNKYLVASVERW